MSTRPLAETTQRPGEDAAVAVPKAWESPRLSYVGHVAEILQVGLGKLSPPAVDPGEPRKNRPSG